MPSNAAIFDRLSRIETDDCVIWPNGVNDAGYGYFSLNGRMTRSHREALLRRVPRLRGKTWGWLTGIERLVV